MSFATRTRDLRRFTTFAVCAIASACASSATSAPSVPVGTDTTATTLSAYFISPTICADVAGPNCTALRLGDAQLTTVAPAVGKLFSCTGANPNAPGSIRSRITWIDDASATWNLLRKPFLPSGAFAPASGSFRLTEDAATRSIQINSLPVDGRIGDWPMSRYAALTAIDPNPGTPTARTVTFTLPINPTVAASPSCVSVGAIGVTVNGVVLYNAADARGNDAVAHEIVDAHGGHPAQTDYHYHFVPERLDTRMSDGHSGIIGYIRDGFAIYGYYGVGAVELSNRDLDECHGHSHGSLGYHYHATMEYPYTVGCYRGTPR
jgi:YHYH protein